MTTLLTQSLSRQDKERLILVLAEKARRHILDFTQFTFKKYRRPPHIELIAKALEAVERGEIKKLMIFMPPRHGKSELVSVRFPAWYLGRNPDNRIILSSYAAELSSTFSKQVRDILEDRKTHIVFDVTTAEDSRARDKWDIAHHRGGMVTAGVGGGLTGYGADVLIIDDPVKNREEAESTLYRDKVYEWYKSVARTRLEPNAAIILIMTRWHKQDLAGRLLEEQKDWTIINLPALAEEGDYMGRAQGEMLWPGRYTMDELMDTRNEVGSRVWSALYQQRPQDPATQIVHRDWIQWYEEVPIVELRGAGIDTATSKKTTADNMAFADVIRGKDGLIYIHDVFCDKISVKGFADYVVNQHLDKKYFSIKIEENAAGEAVKQRIDEASAQAHADVPITGFKTSTDKVVRVHEFAALVENGTIRFNRNSSGVRRLVDHLVDFPQGAIDDDVDALGFAIKAVQHKGPEIMILSETPFINEDNDDELD